MACGLPGRRSRKGPPVRILLTNGRFPVSIDLARQLYIAGYTVFTVEDLRFELELVTGSIAKKLAFIDNQVCLMVFTLLWMLNVFQIVSRNMTNLTPAQLEQDLQQSNPLLRDDGIALQCTGRYLSEVHICLDRDDLSPRACARDLRDRCGSSLVLRPLRGG